MCAICGSVGALAASAGDALVRRALCREAIRLAGRKLPIKSKFVLREEA